VSVCVAMARKPATGKRSQQISHVHLRKNIHQNRTEHQILLLTAGCLNIFVTHPRPLDRWAAKGLLSSVLHASERRRNQPPARPLSTNIHAPVRSVMRRRNEDRLTPIGCSNLLKRVNHLQTADLILNIGLICVTHRKKLVSNSRSHGQASGLMSDLNLDKVSNVVYE